MTHWDMVGWLAGWGCSVGSRLGLGIGLGWRPAFSLLHCFSIVAFAALDLHYTRLRFNHARHECMLKFLSGVCYLSKLGVYLMIE